MSKEFPFSYSSMTSYRDAPVTTLFNKYIFKKAERNYKVDSAADTGTKLHKYSEKVFQHLAEVKEQLNKSQETPSDDFINSSILEARTRASVALDSKVAMHMKSGMDSITHNYAYNYLKSPGMEMFMEKEFNAIAKDPNTGKSYNIMAKPDLVFYDRESQKLMIPDLKNILNLDNIDKHKNPAESLQLKTYKFTALQQLLKEGYPIDSVEAQFLLNPKYGPLTQGVPDFKQITEQIKADLETDVAVEAARTSNYNSMMGDKLGEDKTALTAVKETFSEILKSKSCSPGPKCKECPMLHSCHIAFTSKIEYKMQKEDDRPKLDGNIDVKPKEGSDLHKSEFMNKYRGRPDYDEISQGYDSYIQAKNADKVDTGTHDEAMTNKRNQFKASQREFYENLGLSPDFINKKISDDIGALTDSMKVERKMQRGNWENSILPPNEIPERLAVSALDTIKGVPHTWLSDNVHKTVKAISYDRVDTIIKNLDINRPQMTQDIIDKLFKDKRFVDVFSGKLSASAVREMKAKGVKFSGQNKIDIMRNSSKMIDNGVANHLMEGLDRATLSEVRKTHSDALARKIPAKILSEESNMDAVFNAAKESKLINSDPVAFRKKITEMETSFAKTERFKLSVPKNTISSIGKALILAQLAGNDTILNMVNNKVAKVAEFMHTQEREIDTGQHNSTYSTARRLILSDFGSKLRLGSMISGAYSWVASKGGSSLRKVKEASADYALKSETAKISGAHLANEYDSFIYGGVAAAAGLALYSIVPRSPNRDETKYREQAKKKSLKKSKMPQKSSDSYNQNPQSDLREKTKIPGQFGSPFLGKVGLILEEIGAAGYIDKLVDGTLALTKQLYTHSTEVVAKIKLLGKRGEVLSESVVGDNVPHILDKAGKDLGTSLSMMETDVGIKKIGVYSKARINESWNGVMNKLQSWTGFALSPSNATTVASAAINRSSTKVKPKKASDQMPVVFDENGQIFNTTPIVTITETKGKTTKISGSTGDPIREQQYNSSFQIGVKQGEGGYIPDGKLRGSNKINSNSIDIYRNASYNKSKSPIYNIAPVTSPVIVDINNRLPGKSIVKINNEIPGKNLIKTNNGIDIEVGENGNMQSNGDTMYVIEANKACVNSLSYKNTGTRYPGDEYKQYAKFMRGR